MARRIRQTSNVPRLNLYSRFSLRRLLRHGRAEVRRSLQARTVALAVILTLAVAIVFSGVSITSVCASLLNQIMQQSRNDYSNMCSRPRPVWMRRMSRQRCRFNSWSMIWRHPCNPSEARTIP